MDKPSQKPGEQLKANRQAVVFLTCVLLATLIWFINALSKQYSTTIEQAIIYKGVPASALSDQLPNKLVSDVSGRGFDLVQFFFDNDNHAVEIDLQNLPTYAYAGNPNTLSTVRLLNFNANDNSDVKIKNVTPEIIQLNALRHFSKKVPVKADIAYAFKKQYAQSGVLIIQPDSIYVSGDSVAINKLNAVNTVPAVFKELDHTLFRSVKLKQADGGKVSYSTDKVWAYLKVEPFTEGSVTIPVTVIASTMKQVTIVPDIVTVNYHVPLSHYNTIRPEQFEATATFSENTIENKLKVRLLKKPLEVTNINVSPDELDFFIKQQ